MLTNVLDIDLAAQQVSIKHMRGAILLFDFKAAFPSVAHAMLWDVLAASGIDDDFIKALQLFYYNNNHILKVKGEVFPGVSVHSGVRQGCPLSGLLFAQCVDVLLIRMRRVMTPEEDTGAFADDIAAVVADFEKSLPTLAILFREFHRISGLMLQIKKTVFIPLWPLASVTSLRTLIKECSGFWGDITIATHGRYLGYQIGPGSGESSWTKPLAKYERAVAHWASLRLGLFMNTLAYNTYIAPLLEFVAQLHDITDTVVAREQWALRRLAPGPGMWIGAADLENLTELGQIVEFRTVTFTAMAAKLRLCATIARGAVRKRQDLTEAQQNVFRRPFTQWHYRSYYGILCDNEASLRRHGVLIRDIWEKLRMRQGDVARSSFQKVARETIKKQLGGFISESRVRQKMSRWSVGGFPRIVAQRVCSNFALIKEHCRPCVASAYLRATWNGWPTSWRMRTMAGTKVLSCVFGCEGGVDKLEHYAVCGKVWPFLQRARPGGLGLDGAHRSLDGFLLVSSAMSKDDKLAMAIGVYAVGRAVAQCSRRKDQVCVESLLRLHAREGLRGSKARRILSAHSL